MRDIGTLSGLIVGAYLLGSIPFGILVSKALGLQDPRTVGSQNIGFTNVLRVSGTLAGILTLIGDMGKGWLVSWTAMTFIEREPWVLMITTAVIFGHLFSLFLSFHGGKGVATALGAIVGVAPWLGLGLLVTWLVIAGFFRYSSGAAIAAFVLFPGLAFGAGRSQTFILFSLAISILILLKHKENIIRILNGTESRIGKS